MFQTNSRPSSAKATESFRPSPQKPMIGGSVEKALKKLNGARLTAPALFIVETQPTGRGTISALNGSHGIVVLSRKCGSMNMSIPYRCKGSPGKRVEDIAQNRPRRARLRLRPAMAQASRALSRRQWRASAGRSCRSCRIHSPSIRLRPAPASLERAAPSRCAAGHRHAHGSADRGGMPRPPAGDAEEKPAHRHTNDHL